MGYNNPPITWSELERKLSDRSRPGSHGDRPVTADGGDSPAWSQQRGPYVPPKALTVRPEKRCRTPSCTRTRTSASSTAPPRRRSWSRRRTGSACTRSRSPTTTASTASARFAEAAAAYELPTVFGAELSLGLTGPQNGEPDPEGSHLLVLAAGQEGYHRLAGAITEAQLRGGEKGRPVYDLERARRRRAAATG